MQCPKCNHMNRPGARFCAMCRTVLGPDVSQPGIQPSPGAGNYDATQWEDSESGKGNLNKTVHESAGPRIGGAAAASTVMEGAVPLAPMPGQPAAPGAHRPAGGTMYKEEVRAEVLGWLVVLRSRSATPYTDIPLSVGQNKLGRHQLMDPEASGDHMIIAMSKEQDTVAATLIDQGSRNGTIVNSKKVQVTQLQEHDRVRVGKTTLVYVPRPRLKRPAQRY